MARDEIVPVDTVRMLRTQLSRRRRLLPKATADLNSHSTDLQRHPYFFTMSVSKIAAERNQKALMELAMRPGNG